MIYVLGGSSELSLEVINGTSAPSSPKENTVWVNTSADITSWDFSAKQPPRRSKNKNLLVYPYDSGSSLTSSGVTYSCNSSGHVTVNGTASANSFYRIYRKEALWLEPGTYTISGCPAQPSSGNAYTLYVYNDTDGVGVAYDYGSGKTFTITKKIEASISIQVLSGKTASSAVFKPQLEKASSATTYVKGDATGQVWVQTSEYSDININALKKNGIWLGMRGAKQYISGAWTSKDTEIYHAGEWHELTGSLVLYDADTGVDNTAVTGGIRYDTYSGSSSNPQHQTGFAATYTGTGYFGLSTDNAIDLSGYNTLNMTVVVANSNLQYQNAAGVLNEDLCLYSALGTGTASFAAFKTLSSGTNTLSIPVSSLSGSHVLGIAVGCSSSNTITLKHLSLE